MGKPRRWSYSSTSLGLLGRAGELVALARDARRDPRETVQLTLDTVRSTCERVRELTGMSLQGQRVLDVGPGQLLRQMRCFSLENDVVGIDQDVVPQGFSPLDYLEMLRRNSATRALKTLGRRALGVDAAFERALAEAVGVQRFPRLPLLRMDATRMTFPSGSFDFVCSYSVFEHIDDPRAALAEVARVLRPGGVAYVSLHLYTSHSGHHDPRLSRADGPAPPYWPHLREAHRGDVRPSTYLNELRLPAWHALFAEALPGARLLHETQESLAAPLEELRARGELLEYGPEELLTLNLVAVWKKPAAASVDVTPWWRKLADPAHAPAAAHPSIDAPRPESRSSLAP